MSEGLEAARQWLDQNRYDEVALRDGCLLVGRRRGPRRDRYDHLECAALVLTSADFTSGVADRRVELVASWVRRRRGDRSFAVVAERSALVGRSWPPEVTVVVGYPFFRLPESYGRTPAGAMAPVEFKPKPKGGAPAPRAPRAVDVPWEP